MNIENDDFILLQQVDKFEKAVIALKSKITMQEIAQHLQISPGFLSRYKKPQLYNLSVSSYENIFATIDALVLKKCNKIWDQDNKEYQVKISEAESLALSNIFNEKIKGIAGSWVGCSYNKEKTDHFRGKSDQTIEFFNIFKLNISETGAVNCSIEKAEMAGLVSFVDSKTISIYLQSDNRRLILFARVGLRDNLSGIQGMNLSYIDSGDKFIKCGMATINRADYDDNVAPGCYKVDQIENFSDYEKNDLTGKQTLISDYNF